MAKLLQEEKQNKLLKIKFKKLNLENNNNLNKMNEYKILNIQLQNKVLQ